MFLEQHLSEFSDEVQECMRRNLKDVNADVIALAVAHFKEAGVNFPSYIQVNDDAADKDKAAVYKLATDIDDILRAKNVIKPGEDGLVTVQEMGDLSRSVGTGYFKLCSEEKAEGGKVFHMTKEELDLYAMASSLDRRRCKDPHALVRKMQKTLSEMNL